MTIARYWRNRIGDKHLSQLARIRHKQQNFGRRALGLFVAVWLNLALQPCAMAYDVEADADCPDCPPAGMQHHDGMHSDMGRDMPCADADTDCMLDADWNHDGRSGQSKLKDAQPDVPIAIAAHERALPFSRRANTTLYPRYASVYAGAPPPLHVLHCVYLK
jgi:hypothetical protein